MKEFKITVKVVGTDEVLYTENSNKATRLTQTALTAMENGCYVTVEKLKKTEEPIEEIFKRLIKNAQNGRK